ncbi:MAG: SDR family oxidoreductase [Deltaproteobacteria bacterium]
MADSAPNVLITGVTGFIGSCLAAALLARGGKVLCLVRGEARAERTLSRIEAAASGQGLELDAAWRARVEVAPYDLTVLEQEHAASLAELDVVWHLAAMLSFSSRKLRESMDFNVGGTHALYDLVRRCARGKPRFHYVSTAYTGGVEARSIREEVHLSPRLVNPYFVSKWCTELILEKLARSENALPVTIYRPTLVVGHSQTGWYGGQSYGLYNFVDAVHAGNLTGRRRMHLDIAPGTHHNYIPIDDVIQNCVALSCQQERRRAFEVFHDTGTENSNRERVDWISQGLGLELRLGRPSTLADYVVDRWVSVNKPFNCEAVGPRPFPFESGGLSRLLGADYSHHAMDERLHLELVRSYREHTLKDVEARLFQRSRLASSLRFSILLGLTAILPKRPIAGLFAREVARAHGYIS